MFGFVGTMGCLGTMSDVWTVSGVWICWDNECLDFLGQ